MKQLLLTLLFCLGINFVDAQMVNQPYIATATVIPASPTPNDIVKIATHVTTPNQGIVVDQINHTVSQNPNEINIKGCYWQGLATAIQEYRDTLVIGQLQAGTYTIKQKAYLSSTQQHCSATDSNSVEITLTVSGITGLNENEKNEAFFCFPNPAKETVYFNNSSAYDTAKIYSMNGSLIKEVGIEVENKINVSELSTGLYFIRLSGQNQFKILKFIKED